MLSQPHVLIGCGINVEWDQAKPRLRDSWANAAEEGQLPDRRKQRLLMDDTLNLMQHGLPLAWVSLARLLAKAFIDLRHAASGICTPTHHKGFDPGGGIPIRTTAPR